MKSFEGSGPNEKPRDRKLTRRQVLGGGAALFGAAAIGGSWGKLISDESFGKYEDQYEKLKAAQELIPEDIPVTVSISESGELRYQHEDFTTTRIVDYLSGKGEVTEEYLAARLRGRMFEILESAGEQIDTSETRDYLYQIDTKEELVSFFTEYAQWNDRERWEQVGATTAEEFGRRTVENSLLLELEARSQIKPELYEVNWQLYIEAGAPVIELIDTAAERKAHKNHLAGSSDYFSVDDDGSNRTIHLDFSYASSRMLRQLVQELAHSYGAYKDFESFQARRRFQVQLLGNTSTMSANELFTARSSLYHTEGTEEYYAHRLIMPAFMERLSPYFPDFANEWNNLKERREESHRKYLQNQGNSIE